ncbi:MAG: hypothetical protein JZU65_18150 [Chlorobium sp.]|nr:hypothetical protein [Chlorobium sp.]
MHQQATAAASKTQGIFKENLELLIHKADSAEAIPYNLSSSTNVFINDEWVPVEVVTSEIEMEKYRAALL